MAQHRPGVPEVRSVRRATDILNAFIGVQRRLTLSQIAAHTGLDRNTTRRLLTTLEAAEYVRYDLEARTYSLSTGILILYPSVDYGSNLREVASPILGRLSAQLGQTSFAWTYLKGQALCVERVRGGESLYELPWTRVGTRIPINSGAGPRVLMAHLPAGLRAEALSSCTGCTTYDSRTDLKQLEDDSAAIRARGWEMAMNDYVLGITGLGVPIFSTSGHFAGSVSVSASSHQFLTKEAQPPQLAPLLDAAAEIGFCLKS